MSSDCVKSIFTPRLARQHRLNEFLTRLIRQLTVVGRRGGSQVDPAPKGAVGMAAKMSPAPCLKHQPCSGHSVNTPLRGGVFFFNLSL